MLAHEDAGRRPRGRGGCARAAGAGCPSSSRPCSARRCFSVSTRRGRAALEQRGPVGRVEQVRADDPLAAEVQQVERAQDDRAHGSAAVTRRGAAGAHERGGEVLDRGRRPTRCRPRAGRGSAGPRTGASAVDACVIRDGCSMRLSTPPRLSASFQIFVRATSATASSSLSTRNEIIPPKSRICRACDVVPGMAGQAGVEHGLDRLVAGQELGDLPGVLAVLAHADGERLDAAQHEPGVERARARRRATSAGSGGAPRSSGRSWRRSRRSRRSARRGTSSSSGRRRLRRGRAAAAGTASRRCCRRRAIAPAACAASAAARMSTMFRSGFVGDSIQTIRVCSSRCSARDELTVRPRRT